MTDIVALLGDEAESLLTHTCKGFRKEDLYLPGPDFVDRVMIESDRAPNVLRALQELFNHGRLAGTGYVAILPVDQGIEHSAGSAFAPNPIYFDPKHIVELAIDGGCNSASAPPSAFWPPWSGAMPIRSPLWSSSTTTKP